jgi:hypothetical protein
LAVIAAAQWRCLLAAAATVAALVLVSACLFGTGTWLAWIEGLPGHAAYVDTAVNSYRKQSILANLALLHVSRPVAQTVQAACALAAAILVWRRFPGAGTEHRIAVLAIATFLAEPYAFLYDMLLLTNAALVMLTPWPRTGWADRLIVALLLAFPAVVTLTTRFFWVCSIALILFFAVVVGGTPMRSGPGQPNTASPINDFYSAAALPCTGRYVRHH